MAEAEPGQGEAPRVVAWTRFLPALGCGSCNCSEEARGQDATDADVPPIRLVDDTSLSRSGSKQSATKGSDAQAPQNGNDTPHHIDPSEFHGVPVTSTKSLPAGRSSRHWSATLSTKATRLSNHLSKSLGVEFVGEGTTPKPGSPQKGDEDDASSACEDDELLGASSRLLGVTELERERGIHIERGYEYYNPQTQSTLVRKMNSGVFHHRARDDDEASSSSSRSSQSSAASSGAKAKRVKHAGSGRPGGVGQFMKALTLKNPEAVSHWGVLAGKLMHTQVLDFKAITDKAVHKTKYKVGATSHTTGTMLNRVRDRAKVVVMRARHLAQKIEVEKMDKLDCEWDDPDVLVHLFSTEYLDTLILIARAACKMLAAQPPVAEVSAPCKVFGDIHGQFRDLMLFFIAFGSPAERNAPMFVFNGDFVDRGEHQLETIGLLLALKVLLPERVWLVRGNHEDRLMNQKYGFQQECHERLGKDWGQQVFDVIQKAFDQLPLGAVIADRVLVVHGGIGDGLWKVNDLKNIKRPLPEQPDRWIHNILWSDPIEDDAKDAEGVFGVHDSPRGGITARFGWNVTKTFCARNGLGLIVRSHQSKRDSIGFDIMHDNLLIRVFSARDYEGHGNDGAVLNICESTDEPGLLIVRLQVLRSATKEDVDEP